MSMRSRYEFTKNLYKDYIVLIYKKNKYYSFDSDIGIASYKDNNYNKYLYISYIKDLLISIKSSLNNYE